MPVYKYKAVTTAGESIEGTFTANSKEEVLGMLRQNRHFPVKVEESIERKDVKDLSLFSKVKTKDIAVFCRQFSAMLTAGVTIISCLDILRQQTEKRKLREVIGDVYEEVQKGLTLSESMGKHCDIFPELLINMVEAGEVSGNLDTIMNRMASHYEKENKINTKVQGAMVYPIILSVVATLVVIFLLTFVMPTFVGMFEGSGVELPLPTRILLTVSGALQGFWYIFLAIGIVLVYGIQKYVTTDTGKYALDLLKFRIPVVSSTTKKVITSRFTRTLSTLMSSGIPLIQALEIVAKVVGNKVVSDGILRAKEEVKKGIDLATPIEAIGIFPPMVNSMIRIGEESGALDEILEKTANYYDEEVESAIQKMTTMLEPLMIVLMAVVIGAIVIAMILPMFDMINTISL